LTHGERKHDIEQTPANKGIIMIEFVNIADLKDPNDHIHKGERYEY
jgi:hypothetical protein